MAVRSLSKTDVVAFCVAGLLMVVPIVMAQSRTQEMSNRATCAANGRGIVQAMNIYGADNDDVFPLVTAANATTYDATLKPAEGPPDAEKTIHLLYSEKLHANNPYANAWILVVEGDMSSKQFICRSDPFGNTPAATTADNQKTYTNFQNARNVSYSLAYPWTVREKQVVPSVIWKATADASLAIVSDMAPYFGRTAKPGPDEGDGPVADQWVTSRANSDNHQGDGQNVAFSDAHCEFVRVPAEGQNNDSIWGIRKDAGDQASAEIPIAAGTLPHPPADAPGNTDVVMVPTRDAAGNLK